MITWIRGKKPDHPSQKCLKRRNEDENDEPRPKKRKVMRQEEDSDDKKELDDVLKDRIKKRTDLGLAIERNDLLKDLAPSFLQ